MKMKNHGVITTDNHIEEVKNNRVDFDSNIPQNWKQVDQRNYDDKGIITTKRMAQMIYDYIKSNPDKNIFLNDIMNNFNWVFGHLVLMGFRYLKVSNQITTHLCGVRSYFKIRE